MQVDRVAPDIVGFNGFRARITLLTHPELVSSKISGFNGKANFVGVTCNTTYEISSSGPFTHRRVLFKSTFPWPASLIGAAPDNPAGGFRAGECLRATAGDLSDPKLTGCLRRLFRQDTVRGVLQGATSSLGITVIKDETTSVRGIEDGMRRSKKFWNTLKAEPTMQYNILPTGGFDMSLANAPQSQHVYLADIFSYGLEGLDSSLPGPKTQSAEALFGASAGVSGSDPPAAKRMRSEDSVMSGGSNESFSMKDLGSVLDNPMAEDRDGGTASISTEMKLYFRQV